MEYVVVFMTAPSDESAKKIALELVDKRLAACVNVVPNIYSIFRWKKKIDEVKEFWLVAKTKKTLVHKIMREVKKLHPYEVPEIIALPIVAGNKEYLHWVNDSCGSKKKGAR